MMLWGEEESTSQPESHNQLPCHFWLYSKVLTSLYSTQLWVAWDLTIFHHKNSFTQAILRKGLKQLVHFISPPSLGSAAPQSSWFNNSKKQSRSLFILCHFFQYCWQNNSDDNITDCNQTQRIHYRFHFKNNYFALAFLDAFRSNKSINKHSECLLFQC